MAENVSTWTDDLRRGVFYEIETQLLFGKELGYLNEANFSNLQSLTEECSRMLAGLLRSLNQARKR